MTHHVRLKDLGRWHSGGTPPRDASEHWTGDIPWISAKDIHRTALRTPTTFITRRAALAHSRLVPSGSLLLIVRGMALAHGLPVVRVEREVAFNQDLRALVCEAGVESRFAYYALLGARRRLNRHIDRAAHGTARVTDSIYGERLPVPSPAIQSKIAGFLDCECARIDALRNEFVELRELLTSSELAEIEAQLFVEGDGGWFGAAREGWILRSLSGLGSLFDGDWIEAPYLSNDGIRLIQTGNVGRGGFAGQSARYITPKTFAELKCSAIEPGDVLFSRLNLPIGRACVAPSDIGRMIAAVDIAILRPESAVVPDFLVAVASTDRWLGHLEQLARGTTMQRVARSQLGSVRVPLPPLGEQRRIADVHLRSRRKRSAVEAQIDSFQDGLAEYRDALIAEAVSGKLDVTRLSDRQMEESALAATEGAAPGVLSA